jgi:hypothetical protein
MDDATRARLISLIADGLIAHDDRAAVRDLLHAHDALLADRDADAAAYRLSEGLRKKYRERLDLAAPVLAAADQWATGAHPDEDKTALFRAVVAWRAARGE